jgi:hypothetical protein
VQVVPNPNNGEFTIRMNSDFGKGEINVFDLTGRKVYSSSFDESDTELNFNLNGLGKGIFIAEISGDLAMEKLKIIVR